MNDIKCPFCDRAFGKFGIKAHIWHAHTEQGQKWGEEQSIRSKNRIFSEETRRKISEKARARLKKDPSKTPFLLNNSYKQSYPEKYFEDFLINHNIDYEKEKYACGYWLDFCFGGKYYIEIDGEQHYLPKNIEHDKIRTEKLAENGFVLLQRIRWKLFKNLDKSSKEEYLQKLESCIKQHNDEYIEYNINKKEKAILKRKKEDGSLKREQDIEVLQKILNCGVDLMKHGYVDKISKITGLAKYKVSKILKQFKIKTCIRHKRGNSIKVSAIDFDSIYSCSIQDCPAITGKEGKNNNCFNTCWVTNYVIKRSIRIPKEFLFDYIADGWVKKRVVRW